MLKYKKLVVGEMQTNCYILWSEDKEAVVIDPGDEGVEIGQRINELGLKPKVICLTHGHFDHILGATDLQLIFKVPIAINYKDSFLVDRASTTANIYLKKKVGNIDIKLNIDLSKNTIKFCLGDEIISIIKTPGHTPGCVSFYCKDTGLVFTGDTLFADGLQGETTHKYSSTNQIVNSIKNLLKLPAKTMVLPGHGDMTTIAMARKFFN